MVCVAVTRGGVGGSAWLFGSRDEADLHPLVQYGDALIDGPDSVMEQYNLLNLHELLSVIGDSDLRERVWDDFPSRGSVPESRRVQMMSDRHGRHLFDALVSVAEEPPEDPADICRIVTEDRTAILNRGRNHNMAKNPKTAPENKADAPAEKKDEKPSKPPKYADDAKIILLADKEGKKYGKDHNPKRAGSKSAERFALYTDEMTVKSFLDAGGTVADLDHDIKKEFVKIAA